MKRIVARDESILKHFWAPIIEGVWNSNQSLTDLKVGFVAFKSRLKIFVTILFSDPTWLWCEPLLFFRTTPDPVTVTTRIVPFLAGTFDLWLLLGGG